MEKVKHLYGLYKPLLLGVSPVLLAMLTISLFDWSGATGWFLLWIIGAIGSLVALGFGIHRTIAYLYVDRHYTNVKVKKPSYKAELRNLQAQRKKAVRKIFEYRGERRYREQYETSLTNIERKIADHMGLSDK